MGEAEGIEFYRHQLKAFSCQDCRLILKDILPEELGHELDLWEHSREAGGGALRSTVLGANDGLGSLLALVAGVAGATAQSGVIVVAGVAGLIAGAVSMGASNYISVKSEQDALKAAGEFQRIGIEVALPEKLGRLRARYESRGLTAEESRRVVDNLAQDKERLLETLLREELGVTPQRAERPRRLGAYTFVAFALAGAIPVFPFLVLAPLPGLLTAVAATGIALFLSGVVRTLVTLGHWLWSGTEMLLIGMGSATATYLVGLLIGSHLL
jgi:VIT1/CCC1 family predicted Fe2+/Mn2+ transporter